MRRLHHAAAVLLGLALAGPALPAPAHAAEAEARDVARSNNCAPGRLEVLLRIPGPTGRTVYKIDCTGARAGEVSVRVECKGRTCTLLN
jgi:hypothetical protein